MFSFYVIYCDTWRGNNIKFVRSFVRSLVRSFTHSLVRSFVRSLTRSFVPSFTHSLARSLALDLRAPIKECDNIGRICASHGIIWDILGVACLIK